MRVQGVLDSFPAWAASATNGAAEVFLADVLGGKVQRPPVADAPTLFDSVGGFPLPWEWAVETVMLRLALPVVSDPADPMSTRAML